MSFGQFNPNSINLNIQQQNSLKTKQSSNVDFAATLKQAVSRGAGFAGNVAGGMAGAVPGAAILSNAFGGAAANLQNSTGLPGALGMGNAAPGSTGPAGPNNMFAQVEDMQEKMMSRNMYMITLQRDMQQMSEYFTTISNLMKTKHDTEKNAISNIR